MLFVQDLRQQVAQAHPELTFVTLAKKLGEMWRDASEETRSVRGFFDYCCFAFRQTILLSLQKYGNMAQEDQARFVQQQKAYAAYQASLPPATNDSEGDAEDDDDEDDDEDD
jgi:hypothetical protein